VETLLRKRITADGMCKPLGQEHAKSMTDRDEFLRWVKSALYEAEVALLNGDEAPRRRSGPVTSP
jgi:hypothetical protein